MAIQDCTSGSLGKTASPGWASSACRCAEALVSAALGIDLTDLRSGGRGRASTALARQTAMYLTHVHFGLSLSEVGRGFGRDRTTVAHACALIEDRRDDPKFDRVVACLEAALESWDQSFLAGAR